MGVTNVTPNSFSDGGKILGEEAFAKQVRSLLKAGAQIIDVGAESTAPGRGPVSFSEEMLRLSQTLLPYLEKYPAEIPALSLDTYKTQTLLWAHKEISHRIQGQIPQSKFIWNDVSGVLDEELADILCSKVSTCEYVYSHNLQGQRALTGGHWQQVMDAGSGDEVLSLLVDYFKRAQETFKRWGVLPRVIFDPCFGFSKSREQNLWLLEKLPELLGAFPKTQRWLLGLSRKSFLRPLGTAGTDPQAIVVANQKQREIVGRWKQELADYQLIIRVHDPKVF